MMRRIGFVQAMYAPDIPAGGGPAIPPGGASPTGAAPTGGAPPVITAPPLETPPANPAPWGTDPNQPWKIADKPWYEYLPDGGTKDLYRAKNYANPVVAADSHFSLNRQFSGFDEDKIIRIPDANAKPEDWEAVHKKLGRPETPEGYKDVKWGDNADPGMVEFGKNVAFKLGLSPAAVEGVMAAEWNKFVGEQNTKLVNEAKAANDAAVTALKTQYGENFTPWMQRGNQVLESLKAGGGLTDADFAKLEAHIGVAETIKLLVGIGKLMPGEGGFPNAGGGGGGDPADAQAAANKINELANDATFQGQLSNANDPQHAAALERWEKLYKAAGKLAPGAS